ncbi:hypothetical protein BDN72DRAFT_874200 [Pluteus cervinus]|uniref:Uncharacterized protein n=1 Tax=Pluteus cervinus TaxID=181527 RepID=A0ACD3BEC7_9AGAR|nr:hypothetical protein BDN72DRAFT_874200 [Pluteus cervinus]
MYRMLKPLAMLMPMPIISPPDTLVPPERAPPAQEKEPAGHLRKPKLLSDHIPKRVRSGLSDTKRHAIRLAKRKHAVKKAANLRPEDAAYCHVYVGQINSGITAELLTTSFEDFGLTVRRVQIRCSVGQAVVTHIPTGTRQALDRQYATVEFYDPKSAKRALHMNGALLDGCTLLVTPSPLDLPEASEIVSGKAFFAADCAVFTNLRVRRLNHAKPTQVVQTSSKNWFMDVSFAKCIM